MTDGRGLPWNREAERAAIGAMLVDPERVIPQVRALGLRPGHLFGPEHEALADVLFARSGAGEPCDQVVLLEHLARGGQVERYGGISYVCELADRCVSTANVAHYVEQVISDWRRRELLGAIEGARSLASEGLADPTSVADRLLDAVARSGAVHTSRGWAGLSSLLERVKGDIDNREHRDNGISTGFRDVDRVLGGLFGEDLYVLAARPAMGKTALALNVAQNVAHAEHVVGVFSLEMSSEQLGRRLLSGASQVSGHTLRCARDLTLVELERIDRGARWLASQVGDYLQIDDTPGLCVSEIASRARRLKHDLGQLDLVVIDYLQLIEGELGNSASREREVAHMSRRLKLLAKELRCAVLLVSQLNRSCESRKDRRPQLADLRESGAIEQDADAVLFVFRGSYYEPKDPSLTGLAELIVAKNRNGPITSIDLNFCASTTSFSDCTIKQILHGGRP